MRRFWNDGQEIKLEDLNAISSSIERGLFDRIVYELVNRTYDSFFGDGFYVAYVGATSVSITNGLGFQHDAAQTNPEPTKRMLYLPSNVAKSLTAAHGTLNRIDIICVKNNISNDITANRKYKDPDTAVISLQSMTIQKDWLADVLVVDGTPGGSPSAPATPSGYIKLCECYVHAVTGLAGQIDITDFRNKYLTGNYYNVIIDTNGDFSSLASYISNQPKTGDKVLVKIDQTITSKLTIPSDIEISFLKGKKIICASALTTILEFLNNSSIKNLKLFLSHTGTSTNAILFSGHNSFIDNCIIENSSTGIVTNAFNIASGNEGNMCDGVTLNSGAGSITNIIADNSENYANELKIIERK
jgi:hypothetical protein